MLEGIDVSHYQGRVDWAKAKRAGAVFAWVKAAEGTGWVDKTLDSNAAGTAAADVLVGPYHFWKSGLDPVAQARHFAKTCAPYQWTLPPALDLEDEGAATDAAVLRRYVEEVARLMGRPVIYTSAGWIAGKVIGDRSWLAAYPLWIAAWTTAPSPAVPSPWREWTVWQHGGMPGSTFGVQSTSVDHNRTRLTVGQLAGLVHGPASTAPNMGKVVWFLEDAQRRCEAEGLAAESAFIGAHYTSDAKSRR